MYRRRHVNGNTTNMWCIRLLFMFTFNISKFKPKDKVGQTYGKCISFFCPQYHPEKEGLE